MNRFHDCGSCAFSEVEEALCDSCREGDQWEPIDSDGEIITHAPRTVRIMKHYGKKKEIA